MIKNIDCRGMSCPLPVVYTKKHFETVENGTAIIIVDNEIAKNNVLKLAQSSGYVAKFEEKSENFYITITKALSKGNEKEEACTEQETATKNMEKFTVVFGKNKLGDGDEELGNILIKGYVFALSEADIVPTDLIFFNSGVKLAIKDSAVIDSLKKLELKNVRIQVCGTCLDFYGLKEILGVGEISNMYSIVETMNSSDKIINI